MFNIFRLRNSNCSATQIRRLFRHRRENRNNNPRSDDNFTRSNVRVGPYSRQSIPESTFTTRFRSSYYNAVYRGNTTSPQAHSRSSNFCSRLRAFNTRCMEAFSKACAKFELPTIAPVDDIYISIPGRRSSANTIRCTAHGYPNQTSPVRLPTYEESAFDSNDPPNLPIFGLEDERACALAFDTMPQPPKYFVEQVIAQSRSPFSYLNVNVGFGPNAQLSFVSSECTGISSVDNANVHSANVISNITYPYPESVFIDRPRVDQFGWYSLPPDRSGSMDESPPPYTEICPPEQRPRKPLRLPPFYTKADLRAMEEHE